MGVWGIIRKWPPHWANMRQQFLSLKRLFKFASLANKVWNKLVVALEPVPAAEGCLPSSRVPGLHTMNLCMQANQCGAKKQELIWDWTIHVALLFCAHMKLAQIQCKSQINRNLSSQVTLDGHCFHGKVASWCPPSFDKVAQPCECVHACTQAPRGF